MGLPANPDRHEEIPLQKKSLESFFISLVVALAAGFPIFVLARKQMLAELWLPCGLFLFLLALPPLAQWAAPSMLKGLFDLDLSPRYKLPVRLFFVTLAAYSLAATAYTTGRLMILAGPERCKIPPLNLSAWMVECLHPGSSAAGAARVFLALSAASLYVAAYAIIASYYQDPRRSLVRMAAGALAAIVVANLGSWLLIRFGNYAAILLAVQIRGWQLIHGLGRGYTWPFLVYHTQAVIGALFALALYAGLGIYGRRALGHRVTVAALIGPLMVAKIFGWAGAALIFYLGLWSTPVFLVVIVAAVLARYFHGADHTYEMVERSATAPPAPYTVLSAKGRRCAIVVAAAGGGIQAAAWTAQVLKGLHDENGAAFDQALCALSGISGGSTGSACYVHWLANPAVARDPVEAASDSSLDEVAWGLAWPDLIRIFLPWVIGRSLDRAGAMERAWMGNASKDGNPDTSPLQNPLSDWNERTARGDLPALFMGSTMVESGFPLVLGTSEVKSDRTSRTSDSWMEGLELHCQGDQLMDIPVVRAARLSASFPYVTPAARPRLANQQPHMIDGGFFDNFGMATLTEWLDQALEEQIVQGKTETGVNRILLIQTNGFPADAGTLPTAENSHQGWPFQVAGPVVALANVRTAGQTSHRDIEFGMLKQKWAQRGVEICDAVFEFNHGDAPLSWHLMPLQKAAIPKAWNGEFDTRESSVMRERKKVREFLSDRPAAGAAPAAVNATADSEVPSR